MVAESLRIALILAVATAAVGALAGAATLGTPIIIGLQKSEIRLHIARRRGHRGARLLADGLLILALVAGGGRRAAAAPLAEVAVAPE